MAVVESRVGPRSPSQAKLRSARRRLADACFANRQELILTVVERIRDEVPESMIDRRQTSAGGFIRVAEAMVSFCLGCVVVGDAAALPVPATALAQTRSAARHGIGVGRLVASYGVGASVFSGFIASLIVTSPVEPAMRFALLQEIAVLVPELMARVHAEVSAAHADELKRLAPRRRGARPEGSVRPPESGTEPLTVREAEVYELLVHQGMSDRQIAAALHITLDTVHTHVNRILRKCRAYSRRHLRESVRADSAGVPAAATLLAVDYTRRPTPVPGLAPSRPELAPWGPPAQAPGRVPLAVARYA